MTDLLLDSLSLFDYTKIADKLDTKKLLLKKFLSDCCAACVDVVDVLLSVGDTKIGDKCQTKKLFANFFQIIFALTSTSAW